MFIPSLPNRSCCPLAPACQVCLGSLSVLMCFPRTGLAFPLMIQESPVVFWLAYPKALGRNSLVLQPWGVNDPTAPWRPHFLVARRTIMGNEISSPGTAEATECKGCLQRFHRQMLPLLPCLTYAQIPPPTQKKWRDWIVSLFFFFFFLFFCLFSEKYMMEQRNRQKKKEQDWKRTNSWQWKTST